MTEKEIRVQYSGFIIFASKMLSIASGMIFLLLITRTLGSMAASPEEAQEQFGIWGNIFDLIAYFMLLSSVVPFWTTRFVARGKEGSIKTAFVANLALALISTVIYVPFVPLMLGALNISEAYLLLYLLASTQIIELYLIATLEACLRAKRPQAIGYGLLLEEIFKIAVAYVLIVELRQPLFGAMGALITAVFIQIAYYTYLVRHDFEQKIRWSYVKEWLKGSVANIYNLVGNQIAAFIFILLIIYGGQAARGNYLAAFRIANVITYSFFLSFALYPKLLAKKSLEDVTSTLKMVLMFAIPMTAGALAIPESFLIILDEPYRAAAPVLMFLAIDMLIATLSNFYTHTLFGVEKFDEEAKIPLKRLARSNIFKVFTLPYIHSVITLPTTYFVLSNFALNQPVEAALYVAIINMVARLAMFIVLYSITQKTVKIAAPWLNISKYVFASVVMATVLYVLPRQTRISFTLGITAAGGIIYLAVLIMIDEEARSLIKSIWLEIKSMFKG